MVFIQLSSCTPCLSPPHREDLRQLTLESTRPALIICILNEFILKSWDRPYTANGSTVAKYEFASVKREEHGDHGSAHRFSICAVKYSMGQSTDCPILSVDMEMLIPICEKAEFEDNGNVLKRPLTYSNEVIEKHLPCSHPPPPIKDSGLGNLQH